MKELEDKRPGRFGPNSKLSSGYSITKICFTLGTLLGPVATGFMTRTLGYSYMSYSVGRFFSNLISFLIPLVLPSGHMLNLIFGRNLILCRWCSCSNLPRKETSI